MTAKIINGKEIAEQIRQELRTKIAALRHVASLLASL